MADNDDFELISTPNDQTFELIEANDVPGEITDIVMPVLVSKPVVEENFQVVQKQTPPPSSVVIPLKQVQEHPLKQNVPPLSPPAIEVRLSMRKPTPLVVVPPPRVFAPVPTLPKVPVQRRYGDAASIPHNVNDGFNLDDVLNKSKDQQRTTLLASTRQQQQHDIQMVLERAKSTNRKH